MKPNVIYPLLLAILATSHTWAHSLWIEPTTDGRLVLRFAEPDGRLEQSPGHLDSLSLPTASIVITNTAMQVAATRSTNHFRLSDTSTTNTACAESSYVVMRSPGKPARRPVFYARWSPRLDVAATPALNLDLVPTGKLGEIRIYFRGKPLGGVKATFVSGDGAADQGFIKAGGPASKDAIISCPCNINGNAAFLKAYKAKFNDDPRTYGAEAYDAANSFFAEP